MWMKVDDRLHNHRKTRAVTRSHDSKRRDAAPMGLWVLAGSWSAQNGTDGWVPEEELDRWDDDWPSLVPRLVKAGYWWPHERDNEPGFGFTDWHDYNDPADLASRSGTYGNHIRWHVNEGKVDPECQHCPREPEDEGIAPDVAPISGGDRGAIAPDIAPESGGESRLASPPIALPEPDPNPKPEPGPHSAPTSSSRALAIVDEGTSQTLVAEWIDHCAEKPPSRVIGHVAKEVKTLLDDGIDYDRVRRGLAEWNTRGLHPSVIPSIVHELANRAPATPRGQQATDDLFNAAMQRAMERDRSAR